jgi:hypothetical protein
MADKTAVKTRQKADPAKAVEGRDLTPEEVQAFLASSNERGDYSNEVATFLESGLGGRVVNTSSGALAGRSTRAIKSGLKNAAKNKGVRVHERNGEIALIRTGDTSAPAGDAGSDSAAA